jgi:hypothetical protein
VAEETAKERTGESSVSDFAPVSSAEVGEVGVSGTSVTELVSAETSVSAMDAAREALRDADAESPMR